MQKERQVILYGCLNQRTEEEEVELKKILEERLDWGYIFGQLIHHRIGGYFYINMRDNKKKMLANSARTFEMLVNAQKVVTEERYRIITNLFSEFEEEAIHYAALKGLVYGMTIYTYGARKSNDCDILIWEKDLDKADIILKRNGYVQSLDGGKNPASRNEILIQRMNYHDTVAYYKTIDSMIDNKIKIDLNFHFDSKNNDITKKVLDYGTRIIKKDDYIIRALISSTHFLHMCAHFYREGRDVIWTKWLRDVSLYKIVDLINTLRKLEDVSQCIDIANEFKLNEALYYTLYYMSAFYTDPKINELMKRIHVEDDSFIQKVYDKDILIYRNKDFYERAFDATYCINNMSNMENI